MRYFENPLIIYIQRMSIKNLYSNPQKAYQVLKIDTLHANIYKTPSKVYRINMTGTQSVTVDTTLGYGHAEYLGPLEPYASDYCQIYYEGFDKDTSQVLLTGHDHTVAFNSQIKISIFSYEDGYFTVCFYNANPVQYPPNIIYTFTFLIFP